MLDFDPSLLHAAANNTPMANRNQVRFFKLNYVSEYNTNPDGTPVETLVDAIEIRCPGDQNVVVRRVNDSDKELYRTEWQYYQEAIGESEGVAFDDGEQVVHGTPVDELVQDKRQIHMLKANSVYSVEQLASLSDLQLQKIGMGSLSLRERAVKFLSKARTDKVKELEEKIAKVAAFIEKQETEDNTEKRRGRPPKDVTGDVAA